MNLKDKTVVVTGGSEGLGFSIAKKFSNLGSIVHIISRSKDKLDKAMEDIGGNTISHVADVSNFDEMKKIADEIGQVDVLINNAGVWIEGLVTDNSTEDISSAIDINLKGVIYTTKAFLPEMLKANEAHILNVSSTSGLKGKKNQSVYVASKFGVSGFTKSLAEDLLETNVKVSGFYPGGMNTDLFKKAGSSKGGSDWMDTDKVAELIAFMIEQDTTMVMDHVVLNKRKTTAK